RRFSSRNNAIDDGDSSTNQKYRYRNPHRAPASRRSSKRSARNDVVWGVVSPTTAVPTCRDTRCGNRSSSDTRQT
ncbi:MAG TPA: hypothetical protein VMS40_01475, partial [Vicinamibacterales bacterium]|nr:hypothetical protein [Vicinamibacterales bacterium]